MKKKMILIIIFSLALLMSCTPEESKIKKQIDSIQSNLNIQNLVYGENINFPSNFEYKIIDNLNMITESKDLNVLFVNQKSFSKEELLKINKLFLEGWLIVFYDISLEAHLQINEVIDFYSKRVDTYKSKTVIIDYKYSTISMTSSKYIDIENVLERLFLLFDLRS